MSEALPELQVQWRNFGRGDKTLTCLHPIGLDGGWFDVFEDTLGAEYRLLCPDFRGHGATRPLPGPFTLDDLVSDVVNLWDSLMIQRSAVLGVSLGGMVAQGLIATQPERVSSAVLMCTTDRFEGKAKHAVEERARRAAAPDGMNGLVEETLARWFSAQAVAADAPVVQRARSNLKSQDGVAHAHFWSAMKDLKFLDGPVWSSEPPPPTLVVAGSVDKSFPISVAQSMVSRIAMAELQIVPGEHLFPFEYPNRASALVLDFLRRRG